MEEKVDLAKILTNGANDYETKSLAMKSKAEEDKQTAYILQGKAAAFREVADFIRNEGFVFSKKKAMKKPDPQVVTAEDASAEE